MKAYWFAAFALLPVVSAQTTVGYENLTTGLVWSYVGDTHYVTVHGAANSAVTVTDTLNGVPHGTDFYFGQTDSSGNWTITAEMEEEHVGHWVMNWKVGGVAATPTLDFYVLNPPESQCELHPDPYPYHGVSYDYFDYMENYLYTQSFSDAVAVVTSDSPYCKQMIAYVEMDFPLELTEYDIGDFESIIGFGDSGDFRPLFSYYVTRYGYYYVIGIDLEHDGFPFIGSGWVDYDVYKFYQ